MLFSVLGTEFKDTATYKAWLLVLVSPGIYTVYSVHSFPVTSKSADRLSVGRLEKKRKREEARRARAREKSSYMECQNIRPSLFLSCCMFVYIKEERYFGAYSYSQHKAAVFCLIPAAWIQSCE